MTLALRPLYVAIVGIGCLFPKAAHAGYYWANIKNGVDGIGPVTFTQAAGFLKILHAPYWTRCGNMS